MNQTNPIGLKSGTVRLVEYDEGWPGMFEEEKGLLESALKDIEMIDIQHVGSTSVPGMKSKPVIDIAVGVKRLSDGERCIGPLERIGYEYRGDAGVPGRQFFAKGPRENRTYHVNVEAWNGRLWKNHVLFRDYLKEHPQTRKEYQKLKEVLEAKYPGDRDSYTSEKDSFIKKIIKEAKR
jgi:GrpB-like predicted nucleotidyltransferase (UPF0157 family)